MRSDRSQGTLRRAPPFSARPQRGAAWRRAAWRKVSRTQPVHLREHLLVSPDHGNDDGTPKVVEFLVIHLEAWPHFAKRQIPPGDSDPQLAERVDHAHGQTRDRGVRDLKVLLGVAEPFDDRLGGERFRADPAAQRDAEFPQRRGSARCDSASTVSSVASSASSSLTRDLSLSTRSDMKQLRCR